MPGNRIREIREKAGVSRRALAAALDLVEEQVAYLESGVTSVKVDTALWLGQALGTDLGDVFPGAGELIVREGRRLTRNELVELHYDSDALREFESVGIDLDPATWNLKLRLRGGATMIFVIATAEARRLRRDLQDRDPSTPFFVFRSSRVAVAVNLDHLLHYHELWDVHVPFDWHDKKVPSEEVSVFLSDSATPLTFGVDRDEVEEGDDEEDRDIGQMDSILLMLQTLVEPDEMLTFDDLDGESVFFRMHDVALVTIPLRILSPALSDALVDIELESEDEEDEDEEALSYPDTPR